MTKELQKEVKKELKDNIRNWTGYDNKRMVRDLISYKSFGDYEKSVLKYVKKTAKKYPGLQSIHYQLSDKTPLTVSDYEYIIWHSFVGIVNHDDDDNYMHAPRYSVNQKMTAELFNDEYYSAYLKFVLEYIPENHVMHDYIAMQESKLLIKQN